MATPVNIGVNAPLPAKPWVTEVVQPRVWAVAGPSQDTFVRDAGGAMPTVPLAAPGGAMASGLDPLGDEPLQATLVNGSRLSTVFQANTPFTHLSVALPVALPPFGGAFWAKLLFESSAPTRAWLQDLESQGFTYTAFSEGGRLFVRMSAPNDQAKALPGLITTLLNPHRFQPDEFAQAKAQVLEDLDKKRPPGAQLGIALRQLATGMHHPLFVTPEELAAQLRPAYLCPMSAAVGLGLAEP
jgi:hypothetical protein